MLRVYFLEPLQPGTHPALVRDLTKTAGIPRKETTLKKLILILFVAFALTSNLYALERQEVVTNWAPALQSAIVATVEQVETLTEAEVKIYSSLMSETQLGETLSFEQEALLTGMLSKLILEPSYWSFLETIEGSDLETWLVGGGVLSFGSCNCIGNSNCTPGYTCTRISCTSEEGSRANGVCGKIDIGHQFME